MIIKLRSISNQNVEYRRQVKLPEVFVQYLTLAHVTPSTAENATHIDVVPFAHPRSNLPQLKLDGCEREVVAVHNDTHMIFLGWQKIVEAALPR